MIKALRKAYEMQINNKPFGQTDLHGAFAGLLRREFIDAKIIIVKGEILLSWYVTSDGKYALIQQGFSDDASSALL